MEYSCFNRFIAHADISPTDLVWVTYGSLEVVGDLPMDDYPQGRYNESGPPLTFVMVRAPTRSGEGAVALTVLQYEREDAMNEADYEIASGLNWGHGN